MGRRKRGEEATMDEAKGKAKEAWGAATGDEDKKAEGRAQQRKSAAEKEATQKERARQAEAEAQGAEKERDEQRRKDSRGGKGLLGDITGRLSDR
jgi:uncharacterized protein YjbJ (UPF0337 family)